MSACLVQKRSSFELVVRQGPLGAPTPAKAAPPATLVKTRAWERYTAGELSFQTLPATATSREPPDSKTLQSLLRQAHTLASVAGGTLSPHPTLPAAADLEPAKVALMLDHSLALDETVVAAVTFWTSTRHGVAQVAHVVALKQHEDCAWVALHCLLAQLDKQGLTVWAVAPSAAVSWFHAFLFAPRFRLQPGLRLDHSHGKLLARPPGGSSLPTPDRPLHAVGPGAPSGPKGKLEAKLLVRQRLPTVDFSLFVPGPPKNWPEVAPGVTFCSVLTGRGVRADDMLRSLLVEIRSIKDYRHPCFGQHGVFLTRDVPRDAIVCVYGGQLKDANEPNSSDYVVGLDKSFLGGRGEELDVDAAEYGNEARFINHSGKGARRIPGTKGHNCMMVQYFCPLTGMKIIAIETMTSLKAGTELTLDYGEAYWEQYEARRLEDEAAAKAAADDDDDDEEEEAAMAPASESPAAALPSPGTSPSGSPVPEADAVEPERKRQRIVEPAADVPLTTPESRLGPLPSLRAEAVPAVMEMMPLQHACALALHRLGGRAEWGKLLERVGKLLRYTPKLLNDVGSPDSSVLKDGKLLFGVVLCPSSQRRVWELTELGKALAVSVQADLDEEVPLAGPADPSAPDQPAAKDVTPMPLPPAPALLSSAVVTTLRGLLSDKFEHGILAKTSMKELGELLEKTHGCSLEGIEHIIESEVRLQRAALAGWEHLTRPNCSSVCSCPRSRSRLTRPGRQRLRQRRQQRRCLQMLHQPPRCCQLLLLLLRTRC